MVAFLALIMIDLSPDRAPLQSGARCYLPQLIRD